MTICCANTGTADSSQPTAAQNSRRVALLMTIPPYGNTWPCPILSTSHLAASRPRRKIISSGDHQMCAETPMISQSDKLVTLRIRWVEARGEERDRHGL